MVIARTSKPLSILVRVFLSSKEFVGVTTAWINTYKSMIRIINRPTVFKKYIALYINK